MSDFLSKNEMKKHKEHMAVVVKEKDIAILLSSKEGQKKYLDKCDNAQYRALINKVDDDELLLYAENICKYLCEEGIQAVVTSYRR